MVLRYLVVGFLLAPAACATSAKSKNQGLFLGSGRAEIAPSRLVTRLMPGEVVVIGENHGFAPHHEHERDLLELVSRAWPQTPISVGFEFFSFPDQKALDKYARGKLSEQNFLTSIGWGAGDFSDYRDQVIFAKDHGGQALALNAPKILSRRISKVGMDSLSADEKRLIPPGFQKGNDFYLKRFKDVLFHSHPGSDEQIQRRFLAQSLWDDTMAYQIQRFITTHPDHILIVIVGDFHVAYGGGLPDRLRARGVEKLTVISQIDVTGKNAEEMSRLLTPDPEYGARADFIWASAL